MKQKVTFYISYNLAFSGILLAQLDHKERYLTFCCSLCSKSSTKYKLLMLSLEDKLGKINVSKNVIVDNGIIKIQT